MAIKSIEQSEIKFVPHSQKSDNAYQRARSMTSRRRAAAFVAVSAFGCVLCLALAASSIWFEEGLNEFVKSQFPVTFAGTNDPAEYHIYLWNITNPEEMKNGQKPKLQEVGPICFGFEMEPEFTTRNGSVTYSFNQTLSKRECRSGFPSVPFNSRITHLNVPYLMTRNSIDGLAEGTRRQLEKMYAENWGLLAEHSVEELIHGYVDPTWKNFMDKGVCLASEFGEFGYLLNTNEVDCGEDRTTLLKPKERKKIEIAIETAAETWAVNWESGKEFIPLVDSQRTQQDFLQDSGLDVIDESRFTVEHFERVPPVVDVNSFGTVQFNRQVPSTSELPDGKGFLFDYDGRDDSKFTFSSPHFFDHGEALGVCVDGLSPNEKRHLSRHNLERNTGILIDSQQHMQLNMHLSRNDFERDGYSMECEELQFPLFWDSRMEQLPARHADLLQSQLLSKLQVLERAPPVFLAVACICGILAFIFGIRLWKLNSEQSFDQLNEQKGFIEKEGFNDWDEEEY